MLRYAMHNQGFLNLESPWIVRAIWLSKAMLWCTFLFVKTPSLRRHKKSPRRPSRIGMLSYSVTSPCQTLRDQLSWRPQILIAQHINCQYRACVMRRGFVLQCFSCGLTFSDSWWTGTSYNLLGWWLWFKLALGRVMSFYLWFLMIHLLLGSHIFICSLL